MPIDKSKLNRLVKPFTSSELRDFIGNDRFWAKFEKQNGEKTEEARLGFIEDFYNMIESGN